MHEAQLWDSNLFVTLDYAPEHLASWSLQYRDFQLFMKRLRRMIDGDREAPNGKYPIRFFASGEYGARFRRPHFHAVLYNCNPKDRVRFENGTYRSGIIEEAWGKGNVVIGDVTAQSAAYVAGYTLEKVYKDREYYEDLVDPNTGEVSGRRPEFCTMSRRPGIGSWWYDRYSSDLFGRGRTSFDKAVMDGKSYKVPRYYVEKLKCTAPEVAEEVVFVRFLRSQVVDPAESLEERRLVREECARLNVAAFERNH